MHKKCAFLASILLLFTSGVAARASSVISLTGTTDVVSFNGKANTITLGSASCPVEGSGSCTFAGSQSLGAGTLSWTITTPNADYGITYDFSGGISEAPGATFSASDGVDSLTGAFSLDAWAYDGNSYGPQGEYQGIDLEGAITNLLYSGGPSDPNNGAFNSFLDLPAATSYGLVLDVGNCTSNGKGAEPCITIPDPTATFTSLDLIPASATPEPGTFALLLTGAAAGYRRLRRRLN
ncbi:MAG: PEP-CTERM sorting domain-containing protein [Terracidiphilus sp.]|jgi:hypothetical protein